MGLPKAGLVQLLEVVLPPLIAFLLGDDMHGRTPYGRLAHPLWTDDAQGGVSVELGLASLRYASGSGTSTLFGQFAAPAVIFVILGSRARCYF